MAFHCLLPVRDEADIISQSLRQMLTWADEVHVFDTGSVDETWEIVQELAVKEKRVNPLKKDAVYFSDTRVRGWMFQQARQRMRTGDWFLRVDADEFHHIPPPEFVRTRMRPCETIAWHQYYDFRLTAGEVKSWEEGKETLADRKRPIEERRRWFTASDYSEPRLCRYRETMRWPATASFPYNAGFVARERLPIRHYPHRDPVQLNRRCRLRAVMLSDTVNRRQWTSPELHHWTQAEWQTFITPDDAEGLYYWKPGTPLPEVRNFCHLAKPHIRMMQRQAHAFLLPVLDRCRTGWPADGYPQPMSPAVIARLEQELRK